MNQAFIYFREVASGILSITFCNLSRASIDPTYEMAPAVVSQLTLFCAHGFQKSRQQELVKSIALSIFFGMSAGVAVCLARGQNLKRWSQNFALMGTAYACLRVINHQKHLDGYKKSLYGDILLAISMCASYAIIKSHNPTFPFSAHCVHVILGTVVERTLSGSPRKNSDQFLLKIAVNKLVFLALIFPIQKIFNTNLGYNWKLLGTSFTVQTVVNGALYSSHSPIVQRFAR